jgi:TonB family protein
MPIVSCPGPHSDSALVLENDQADGTSKRSHRPAGARRTALLFLVLALLSIQPLHLVAIGDERNIEQFALKRVQPTYPPLAQKQRIEGVVVVQLSVGANGKVNNAEFLRGNNIFKAVSLDAARRWEFRVPGGEGLEGTIRFTFKLE